MSCQNYQYIHPPGWYLLVSPVVAVMHDAPFPSLVRALRVFDVLLASVAVWATWYIARQVWPDNLRRALFAASLTACFGRSSRPRPRVNNDSLMLALMALSLAVMARILRHGTEPRFVVLLGVLIGAGLLTKGEFLVITGVALLTLLVAPRREALWRTALRFGVPSALGALWWARVVVDTHSLTPAGSEIVRAARTGPWESVSIVTYLRDQTPEFANRFSGVYGWLSVQLPGWARALFQLGVLGSFVAWLGLRRWGRPRPSEARFAVLALAPLLLFLATTWTSFTTFRANGEVRGMAPRYVYGSVPVLAVAAVAALAAIASRTKWLRSGRVVALSLLVVAFAGVVVSFVEAMRGLYATSSLHEMMGRAGVVAPVSRPTLFVVAAAVMWTMAMLATAWLLWTDRVCEPVSSVLDDVRAEPLARG